MARETKQDRIVRTMTGAVTEHLLELKAIIANPSSKELDIERWCQSVMRACLGYSAVDGYTFRAQEHKGKSRPDLVILKGEDPICVVEVKRIGFNLNKSAFRSGRVQLSEYLFEFPNVRWGILTNGYEWRLFDFSDKELAGVEVLSFDVRNEQGEIDVSKRGVEDTCYELFDIHEVNFNSDVWDSLYKEATAFSPESLARAVLSVEVVKQVAKIIRGEHEYKANSDVLLDKLTELVSNGLDDMDKDWNETKQLDLSKYVKSQKRAARKKRRSSSAKAQEAVTEVAIKQETTASSGGQTPEGQGNAA